MVNFLCSEFIIISCPMKTIMVSKTRAILVPSRAKKIFFISKIEKRHGKDFRVGSEVGGYLIVTKQNLVGLKQFGMLRKRKDNSQEKLS